MAEVAILGVGRMGGAMARKLAEAGHAVTLWNRTEAAAAAVAAETGSTVAGSPAEAVAGADVVISILSAGEITQSVLLDVDVLAALKPGTVVCDMATSGVETARTLAEVLSAGGARFVDAPVSGSVPTIAAGQLLVMASGDEDGVAAAEPILMSFSKRVVYLGPAGAGQAMKLAVNLVVHTLNAAVSEALTLASSAGVAPETAYDIFLDSVVAAPFVAYKKPAFLDPDTPVAMSLTLTDKDLRLITEFAQAQGVPALVVEAVRSEVAAACAAGRGDQDMAALARYLGDATER
jgi:3-hydroxyisobutyrate dehydrogenase